MQDLFLSLGVHKGFRVKRSYNKSTQTDGVWVDRHPLYPESDIIIAAIEVIASESPKTIRGSINLLESLAPLIPIILIHESEISRRLRLQKKTSSEIDAFIAGRYQLVNNIINTSFLNFEVWNENDLEYFISLYTDH